MSIEKLINILVTITVIEMMVAIGLGVTFAEVVKVARNLRLVAKAAVANYVCVPAAAVGLLLLFHAHPMVAAGFLIAAVCPGAPYGPPFTAMAKGNVAVSVGLMVILAGASAILAPLLLRVLLPFMAGNEPLKIDAVKMVITLVVSQLLPLCVGMALRQWRPNLAASLQRPARLLSMLLNLSMFGIILLVQFQMLMEVRLRGLVGMFALVLASLVAGWLLGEPGTGNRKAMALTTSVRNVAVSLVIATGSFPGTPAVTAALIYAVFQTIVLALLALVWGRRASAKSEIAPPPTGS
jgi:bile acid:Na+ symporter, BASS family